MYKKILVVIIVLLVVIRAIYGIQNIRNDNENINGNTSEIIKYEIKTHKYLYEGNIIRQYYINSLEELKSFYSLYSDKIDIDENYLDSNSIFIQTIQVDSGSISIKLEDVNFDNNKVNFIIDRNVPEIGTEDMAFWYLIAIIPNDMLKNVDISDWNKPSMTKNNNVDR